MKHNTSTATRRIPSRTNPVTMVPPPALPAPAAMAIPDLPTANTTGRPSNPTTVHNTQPEVRQRRNRRSFEQVVESLETPYEEASAAGRKIQGAELMIARAFAAIGPEAQNLILQGRPDLARYIPQG